MDASNAKELAIVVLAYNRPAPLAQLLKSLNRIVTQRNDIDLILSIDNFGTPEVIDVAEKFQWKHGCKLVDVHQEKLGLKRHFIWAGDKTEQYEHVFFLEDDLLVSPYVMDFIEAYMEKYKEDDSVAGASLYSPVLCEFTKSKFYQFQDGYDNYFFQHPYWGNIWSANKWKLFKQWLETYQYHEEILPYNVRLWGDKSFKKVYVQYLLETQRYIVYPRTSYVTNMGVKGLHNDFNAIQFQVVLESAHRKLHLSSLRESGAVYDGFYQILPEILCRYVPELQKYDFTVDFNGMKDHFSTEYVLTSRKAANPILSFSGSMRPAEQNIIYEIPGQELKLVKAEDIEEPDFFLKRKNREKICAVDIMKNYPVRTKHFGLYTLLSMGKKFGDS